MVLSRFFRGGVKEKKDMRGMELWGKSNHILKINIRVKRSRFFVLDFVNICYN